MLSRIAESLYWIGRYVERAEDTSRILDAHLTLLLDDPWAPEDVVCSSLLAAMGNRVEDGRRVTGQDLLDTLAWDRSNPAAVLGALAVARGNARRCREVVSAEMWECLNVTWQDAVRMRRSRPHAFFRWVRERTAAFTGCADATLPRDAGWQFLRLGRSVERADMTARLIASRALTGAAGPSWTTLLQSCGAYQAFLRSARGVADDESAVLFLLLDRLFPRSLISALVTAERALEALASTEAGGPAAEAQRELGRIRSQLEYAPGRELLDDVYDVMDRVQGACSAASDAITTRYFPHDAITAWAVAQ